MRYNDATNNTHVLDEVLPKYKAAWAKKGMFSDNGLFRRWYAVNQDKVLDTDEIAHSAWVMAFMPWNHPLIKSKYPSVGSGYLHHLSNPHRINVHAPSVTTALKHLAATESLDPDAAPTIARARVMTAGARLSMKPYLSPTFGFISQWLSEVPPREDLSALLRHADAYLTPTWANGGLYYARHDIGWDEDGNYTYVEPYTGNAAIGCARLNVRDGQKKMWDRPLTAADLILRPWIDNVRLESRVDCLRGVWVKGDGAMVATFRTWDASTVRIRPVVKNLPAGTYGVYVDGEIRMAKEVAGEGNGDGNGIKVELVVGERGGYCCVEG
jgi:hypothetical protein